MINYEKCESLESRIKEHDTIINDNKEAFTPISQEEIDKLFGTSDTKKDANTVKVCGRSYLLRNNDEVYFSKHHFKDVKKLRPGMHLSPKGNRFVKTDSYPCFYVKQVFTRRKWVFWKEVTGAILIYFDGKTK